MSPIRILIVEDDPLYAEVVNRLVRPIVAAFPGSSVITVNTIEAALQLIAQMPAPDLTLLDLTLPPSGMKETLAHLEAMEERTAVVIVTGAKEQFIREIIGPRDTPIVEKTADLMRAPGPLMRAICIAVELFQNRKWARVRENLTLLKQVTNDG